MHCCFLVILASKDFPYFPAVSACYCSLRKLIKKSEYIKKETMTVYEFRSASVSTTLSAPLWMKSDSSGACQTSTFISCCLSFPSKWVFLGCSQFWFNFHFVWPLQPYTTNNLNSYLNKIANHIGWWTSWVQIVPGKPVNDTALSAVWKQASVSSHQGQAPRQLLWDALFSSEGKEAPRWEVTLSKNSFSRLCDAPWRPGIQLLQLPVLPEQDLTGCGRDAGVGILAGVKQQTWGARQGTCAGVKPERPQHWPRW